MFRFSLFAPLVCFAGLASAAPNPTASQAKAALARLPLRFEANQGQAATSVRYVAKTSNYTLLMHPGGVTVQPPHSKPLTISLVHSNPASKIESTDQLPIHVNYLVGGRDHWRTEVPTWSRVEYRDIYPGIDAVFYGNQNQFEYDLVLKPGADPRSIRFKLGGGTGLHISPEGDLVMESAAGRMEQKKPVIYQETSSGRREVAGRYVLLSRNVAGLRLNDYDRRKKLVIDPSITYMTYLGGTGQDQINAVKMGPNHRLYVIGQTDSNQIIPSGDAYNTTNTGLIDSFLATIDTTPGKGFPVVYLTFLGGSNNDIPLGLDVDAKGVAYITGTTTSTDFPVTGQAFQSTGAGASVDAYVVQLDPSHAGSNGLLFSSYLGGSADDSGNDIAVDSSGLIYIIGTTKSSDFSVTDSAYQPVLWGPQDTFLTKIDPNAGTILYSTYLGGESDDWGRRILIGKDGLVYFASATLSSLFPMAGTNFAGNPNNNTATGAQDIVIGVMNMNKTGNDSLVYTTYFGGSGNDDVHGMAFDPSGNLLITGYTLNACDGCLGDFPVTSNALQGTYSGNGDAFVAVVNPSKIGSAFLIYSTYLGGSDGDVGYGVNADSAGNIYVTGYTLSKNFPVQNAPQPTWGGGTNIFLTKFKPGVAGLNSISFSTYVGASGTYVPTGVSLGTDGTVYVAGFGNLGLPSSANAVQGGYAGGVSDGFVMVIDQGLPGLETTRVGERELPGRRELPERRR
jgi:hypothetical protein